MQTVALARQIMAIARDRELEVLRAEAALLRAELNSYAWPGDVGWIPLSKAPHPERAPRPVLPHVPAVMIKPSVGCRHCGERWRRGQAVKAHEAWCILNPAGRPRRRRIASRVLA